MNASYETFSTPLGDFSVAVDAAGAVIATAFGPLSALQTRTNALLTRSATATRLVRQQVDDYFRGARRDFDLPLAAAGTAFQRKVWAELRTIPFGRTTTYRALGLRLGHPQAARAIGRANATNPICLIVPCHRVIGADGSLTGFAFGTEIKRRLLEHESHTAARAAA